MIENNDLTIFLIRLMGVLLLFFVAYYLLKIKSKSKSFDGAWHAILIGIFLIILGRGLSLLSIINYLNANVSELNNIFIQVSLLLASIFLLYGFYTIDKFFRKSMENKRSGK